MEFMRIKFHPIPSFEIISWLIEKTVAFGSYYEKGAKNNSYFLLFIPSMVLVVPTVSTSLRDAAQIGDAVIYLQLQIRDASLI